MLTSSTRIQRTIEHGKIHYTLNCNLPYLGDNSTNRLYNTGVIIVKKRGLKRKIQAHFLWSGTSRNKEAPRLK